MKMLYKALKIAAFWILAGLFVCSVSRLVERKDSLNKYHDFMELSDQIDVLFLGSSHILNGINPVQLYSEYGITSYNMGKSGGMLTESYWTFMNALDYCTPDCIVVDLWALDRDYQYVDVMNGVEAEDAIRNSVSLLHTNMDVWPLSRTKIAAVNDLILDREIRKEFLWDFSLYHGRWSSLSQEDFLKTEERESNDYLLGAEPRRELLLHPHLSQAGEGTAQTLPKETVSLSYLKKILSVCDEKGIRVVFTFMPMVTSWDTDMQAVNTGTRLAEERGIPFFNFLPHETQTVIDYYTDMSDETHLNVNGMRKMTSYIGGVLRDICMLPDHRQDAAYGVWEERAARWQSEEIERLCNDADLYAQLGAIRSINASALIFLRGDSKALHDSLTRRFIKQLTGSSVIDEALSANGPYLLVRDASGKNGGGVVNYEFGGEAQPENFDTLLGETTYIGLSDFGAVYVDGNYENNFLDMEEHYNAEAQILILGQQGEVIGSLYYDTDWKAEEDGRF